MNFEFEMQSEKLAEMIGKRKRVTDDIESQRRKKEVEVLLGTPKIHRSEYSDNLLELCSDEL